MLVIVPIVPCATSVAVMTAWNSGADFRVCTGMMRIINKQLADCNGCAVCVVYNDYTRCLTIMPEWQEKDCS